MSNTFKKRVLSGVQPTGGLHLGNYLGAIRNFTSLSDSHESLFCVVDLHAITVWQDPTQLNNQKREVIATFIASGIDPNKSVIFNQSDVPEHTQLSWILNCTAQMGWLKRMTQFKDKAGKNQEKVGVGLFTYPILMASDILLYKATDVPVGEDQKQHLELTRDIVVKFNNDYKKEIFPLPEPMILKVAARVMSLRDGTKKMSKSDPSEYSRILLTDENDLIAKKISKAKSDSLPVPSSAEDLNKSPEADNLLSILASCSNVDKKDLIKTYGGKNYSDLKKDVTDSVVATVSPVREEINRLMNDRSYLEKTIKDGASRAREIAQPVLNEVYEAVGLN
ncbi:MAG: tryptophan--tRNA ligase [Pseudomonadota bacterium]|nr:tryptophan--tRNA ligase [Pseudomonadota bacterium]|tara:strand:- start:3296 stop:4303 length:1008 start_codon:yes stop_codon:yes gene_type:complete